MKAKWIVKAVLGGLLFISAMGAVTMFLWNHLAVDLFNAPIINFFQAIGLLILGRLLTGGFGGHKGGGWKRHYMEKQKMRERWGSMNDEERKQFKERWKANCGPFGSRDEESTDAPAS